MEYILNVPTTGEDGAATGTAETDLPVWGAIWEIVVDYHASAPNTTTVDVDEVGGAARKILDLAAANTDAAYRPRHVPHGTTGTAGSSATEPILVQGRKLKATVDLSDALTNCVTVYIYTLDTGKS